MPAERLSMRTIREVLRNKWGRVLYFSICFFLQVAALLVEN